MHDLDYNYWINRDKRNNSVQYNEYNEKIKQKKKGLVNYYNDSYI